jgi:hypothetical protein
VRAQHDQVGADLLGLAHDRIGSRAAQHLAQDSLCLHFLFARQALGSREHPLAALAQRRNEIGAGRVGYHAVERGERRILVHHVQDRKPRALGFRQADRFAQALGGRRAAVDRDQDLSVCARHKASFQFRSSCAVPCVPLLAVRVL